MIGFFYIGASMAFYSPPPLFESTRTLCVLVLKGLRWLHCETIQQNYSWLHKSIFYTVLHSLVCSSLDMQSNCTDDKALFRDIKYGLACLSSFIQKKNLFSLFLFFFFFCFCPQDEKNQVLMTNAWLQLVSRSLRRARYYQFNML